MDWTKQRILQVLFLVLWVPLLGSGCSESDACDTCEVKLAPGMVHAWLSDDGLTVIWEPVKFAVGYAVSINGAEVATVAAPQSVAFLPTPDSGFARIGVSGVGADGNRGPAKSAEIMVPGRKTTRSLDITP